MGGPTNSVKYLTKIKIEVIVEDYRLMNFINKYINSRNNNEAALLTGSSSLPARIEDAALSLRASLMFMREGSAMAPAFRLQQTLFLQSIK